MTAPARPVLTELEIEVLRLASEGLGYEEIAKRIYVIPRRATAIKTSALRKLGARNIANAVFLACRAGILDGRPQRHGDHAGYEAHRKRGEDPRLCASCSAGEREHKAALKARQKLSAPA
ncbi:MULTISPECIES: helix-turn-helix transcriptional regulator [unclassified Streptomyces]|uniref:helix-turn-helix domain-containing protein n=1 Tax=unclassified Streptomyces TaxID=2593676 RepID=UPI00332D1F20